MSSKILTAGFQPGKHTVKPIPFKPHKVKAMSAELIESHFEIHYGGAVRQLNDIELRLATMKWNEMSGSDIKRLKGEELSAANSVSLHECYFNSLGDQSEAQLELTTDSELALAVAISFGSLEQWRHEFTVMATAMAGDPDWLLLVWSGRLNRLVNVLVSDNHTLLANGAPILVLDMHERAYKLDFGSDVGAYISAFLQSIHWGRVNQSYEQALHSSTGAGNADKNPKQISVRELREMMDQKDGSPLVLDVRHEDDRERYRSRIMQTSKRDSHDVASWSGDLPKDKPIIVYCMYGFWVSQDVATELRQQGYDAHTLEGGIASWRAMGYESTDIDS